MSSMMRAILARCRIASPRLQSGRRRISSRSRDFSRNRAWRRMRPHTRRERPTRASAKVRTTARGSQIGRTGKATAFLTVFCGRTGPSLSEPKVTGTTGTVAMVVHGISARIAIPPSPREKAAPIARRRRAFRRSSPRAQGPPTRIRPRKRPRPTRSLPLRLSRHPKRAPLFSSSRQARAAIQFAPDAGGYDRHMDLAGVVPGNRADRIRLRKSRTIRR
jgi:hypothetical protein